VSTMSTDAHFLAAVAAAPAGDRLPRLVYADWLDDHDDPRGELVRLEEECRGRVAWDDTLWRLKPRRNELRGRTDPAWLAAMGYGTDCEPLFRGEPFPAGWRDGWRLIREAHERWTGDSMPDVGGRRAEVEAAERRLGLTLPPSVREYVAFAHDLPGNGGRDWICVYRDSYTLTPVPGQPALSLIRQAEGDVHWAVRYEDLHRDDPPVYTYYWGDSEDVFVPADAPPSPSVARFMFEYVCGYAADRHGELGVHVHDLERVRAQLREAFPFRTVAGPGERYEATNLHADLWTPTPHFAPGYLRVAVSRPVTREQVPAFLWEYTRGGGSFGGIFIPEEHQRAGHPAP
jgi:uncharacterized protein (TIGR02996 family)